jgi:hypothetical protein
MLMPMVHIRIVCMGMLDRLVNVRVGMRFLSMPVRAVLMLMMGIVKMRVFVLHR